MSARDGRVLLADPAAGAIAVLDAQLRGGPRLAAPGVRALTVTGDGTAWALIDGAVLEIAPAGTARAHRLPDALAEELDQGAARAPASLAVDDDAGRIYLTTPALGAVAISSTRGARWLWDGRAGGARPVAVRLSADRRRVHIACAARAAMVTVDVDSGAQTTSHHLPGHRLVDACVAPAGLAVTTADGAIVGLNLHQGTATVLWRDEAFRPVALAWHRPARAFLLVARRPPAREHALWLVRPETPSAERVPLA